MLELVDIHTYYGEGHILHGVSLRVEAGSVVAILGRNGMGKTTLVHSIIGFTPPRYGEIYFAGTNITHLPPYKISRMGLGLVPQGRRIFPSLSVRRNLTLGARSKKGNNGWTIDRVHSLFPILKERANIKGTLLSGGEQQMLCIGRALLTNPEFLLMDEPSEGLAPMMVQQVGSIITQLKSGGLSILLVEQNLSLALGVSDYVYILSKGEIVYQSTPEELKNNREIQVKHLGVT